MLAVAPVAALLQVYVSGAVPPLAFATALPVPFEQRGLVGGKDVIAGPPALLIVVVAVILQPFASVTVIVYVEAASEFAVAPVVLLLQLYVKLPLPPAAATVAAPLLAPHVAFVGVTVGVLSAGGCVMLIELIALQPFPSVTVT